MVIKQACELVYRESQREFAVNPSLSGPTRQRQATILARLSKFVDLADESKEPGMHILESPADYEKRLRKAARGLLLED